jgi:hypothetical protein
LCHFRQQLICHLLSAIYFCRLCLLKIQAESCPTFSSLVERLVSQLLLQALFTESSCREQLLALPPFSGVLKAFRPLCCMSFSVPCLLFSFLFCFVLFCGVGVGPSRGLCWFIPGVAVGVPCATYLLTYWSVSPKQVWSSQAHLAAWDPSYFLSVTWRGEALCGLGVQAVGVSLILGGFFLPSVAPAS